MNSPVHAEWIGRREQSHERLCIAQVRRIAATLGEPAPAPGQALPPLWHWAFFQPAVATEQLGRDGHPAQVPLLPPLGERNRMWAGGRVEFFEPLRVDIPASRFSSVVALEEKTGRSGALLFATLRHDYLQDGALCLREEQDIVFRAPTPPKAGDGQALPPADWQETVEPGATLLLRYSAVTFNAHRIHYDQPYATEMEGYPGLVVHGPLIATLNLRAFCRAHPEARLRRFAYRGLRPLIAPEPFVVGGRLCAPGQAELWAGNAAGMAQQAELTFD